MNRRRKGGTLTLSGFAPRAATNAQLGDRINKLTQKILEELQREKFSQN